MAYTETIDIAAKKEDVWYFYETVGEWGNWDPDLTSASIKEPFADGSKFDMATTDKKNHVGELSAVTPGVAFTYSVKLPGAVMWVAHRISEKDAGVTITHDLSFTGMMGSIFGKMFKKKINTGLAGCMQNLKRLAEARASGAPAASAAPVEGGGAGAAPAASA